MNTVDVFIILNILFLIQFHSYSTCTRKNCSSTIWRGNVNFGTSFVTSRTHVKIATMSVKKNAEKIE